MKYPQLVSMPSAVSNWLEEQLEARGIDAVVYTRYVLSLFHSHPVDVIYSDDLQLSHLKKEVRKSNGGRKRSRKSSDWWRYAEADAEQIKRSAAVECLVSASDQNCEIESLVDELCEKLKEVNSESTSPISETAASTEGHLESPQLKKISPQELAEKYYAAFPPLCPQSPTESKLLSLIPKWKPAISPIKKKSAKKQANRQTGYKLHSKENSETMKSRSQNKQRFPYFSRNKTTMPRNNNNTLANWDLSIFNRKFGAPKLRNSPEMEESLDQCVENNRDIWASDSDVNMYEDLPVDIKDLLDSPSPNDDNVEMMNMANMRDVGKREYIPYGTNIISSIWSTDQDITYDNTFNTSVDCSNGLDFKFSSISIDNQKKLLEDWPTVNTTAENETNSLFEKKLRRNLFKDDFNSLPANWSNPPQCDVKEGIEKDDLLENEKLLSSFAFSLMKLNHNKEKSCFTEVTPKSSQSQLFNPFTRNSSIFKFNSRHNINFDKDKEDLLTSESSHFKPICEKLDGRHHQTCYADGSTFVISNNLDKVEYKRSDTGTMWLETDQGQSKKYYEYKNDDLCASPDEEFVLKFSICQNDKACQTEKLPDVDFDASEDNHEIECIVETSSTPEPVEEQQCTCPDDKIPATITDNSTICPIHVTRAESMLGEILWKYETTTCEKCNNNNVTSNIDWSTKGQMDTNWDNQGLRDIWNGGEICQTCLTSNGGGNARPAPSLQLREDISQDGEQLLSDLSSIQKTYMDDLPPTELTCDLSELVSTNPKERKRRHSFILDQHPGAWSFASRLEEDCLIQMSTLPTLRSVTL